MAALQALTQLGAGRHVPAIVALMEREGRSDAVRLETYRTCGPRMRVRVVCARRA